MKEVKALMFVSANGRDDWKPVEKEAVPAWVLDEDNMKRLVEGYVCSMPERATGLGVVEPHSDFYRLEVVEETDDIMALREAADKRERKNARRLVLVK